MSNTKQQIREILEQHHSIVTLELGEKVIEAIDRLVTESVEASKVELREKFGIDANKKYDVSIGNGVIVLQESQLTNKDNK